MAGMRAIKWPTIWALQESKEERGELDVLTLSAATLEAAFELADERAGSFLAGAKPWKSMGLPVGRVEWQREVTNLGWQHITRAELYGATGVIHATIHG